MTKGLHLGAVMVGIDQVLFRGRAPWTLRHEQADHEQTRPASEFSPIAYPKPDGVLTFDRLSSVFVSNTNHNEDQPAHLTLKDPSIPGERESGAVRRARSSATARPACTSSSSGAARLQINAQNCVHCKTCDIKDPTQNIVWVAPEGGGGPNYPNM